MAELTDQQVRDEWTKYYGTNQGASVNANKGSWTDYIPNVFGTENAAFSGLLGPDQTRALSKQSNIAGLLGTAAALAQGMGSQGPRRSATQNILAALGAGYGASGNAYQQGIQNYGLQQEIMQRQLAQKQLLQKQDAINKVLADPQIANDPAMKAWVLSNTDKALEMYVKRRGMQQFLQRENQPTQVQPSAEQAAYQQDLAKYDQDLSGYNNQVNQMLGVGTPVSGGPVNVVAGAVPVREPTAPLAAGNVEMNPVPEAFTGKYDASMPQKPIAPTAPKSQTPAPTGHPLDKEIRQADLLSKYWAGEGDDAVKAKEYQGIAKELRTRKTQDELVGGLNKSLGGLNPLLQPLADTLMSNAPNMTSAEIQSAAMDISKKNSDFKVNTETELRKEYSALPEIKEFTTVETAFKQINNALSNPSAANDLAAATKFMKLLDPGSVVRESELGMAMNATGAIDRVQNYFQKLQNGQVLNPEQRADFKRAAQLAFSAAQDTRDRTSARYVDLANSYNVDANNVVLRGKGTPKPAEKQPTPQRNTKGWQLHTDANGNQAYVSPDGTKFEEVK